MSREGTETDDGAQRHAWLGGFGQPIEMREMRVVHLEPLIEICLQKTGC